MSEPLPTLRHLSQNSDAFVSPQSDAQTKRRDDLEYLSALYGLRATEVLISKERSAIADRQNSANEQASLDRQDQAPHSANRLLAPASERSKPKSTYKIAERSSKLAERSSKLAERSSKLASPDPDDFPLSDPAQMVVCDAIWNSFANFPSLRIS